MITDEMGKIVGQGGVKGLDVGQDLNRRFVNNKGLLINKRGEVAVWQGCLLVVSLPHPCVDVCTSPLQYRLSTRRRIPENKS